MTPLPAKPMTRLEGMLHHAFEEFRQNTAPPLKPLGPQITLGDAIQQLRIVKTASNRRPTYIRELSRFLRQFAHGRELEPLASITADSIEGWLTLRGYKPITRRACIGRISALFELGKRKRWLKENPCDEIEKPFVDRGTPRILTPEEVETLMRGCVRGYNERLPYLALALFAGLRPTEARATVWGDIRDGTVTISAAHKVRARRIVNLEPTAIAWLDFARKLGGKLPFCESTRQGWNRWFRSILGWDRWPQDVLRHTCLSYQLASWQDAERVAMNAGNSGWIVHRYYKALVSKEDAAKFWSIMP